MTIWTWNYLHETETPQDRGAGWLASADWLQSAPQSIERVIVRAQAQGIAWDQGQSDWPIAAGVLRLGLFVEDEGGNFKNYYWSNQQVVVTELSEGGLQASPPTKFWRTLQWTSYPFEVDQTIRRAPPAPPAPPASWRAYLTYSPWPYNQTNRFQYLSDWTLDIDVWYLTSEPGT